MVRRQGTGTTVLGSEGSHGQPELSRPRQQVREMEEKSRCSFFHSLLSLSYGVNNKKDNKKSSVGGVG